jgi:hypothetical protein
VLFVPATALARAHAEGRLEEKLTHFAKPKLLIVDEPIDSFAVDPTL